MKLRNLFIATFAAVGLFSSCEDKSGLGALAIELSDYELELKAAGEEKSIKVSASEDWFAEVDWKGAEAWLDISPAEGKAGEKFTFGDIDIDVKKVYIAFKGRRNIVDIEFYKNQKYNNTCR